MDIDKWTAEKCGVNVLVIEATDEIIWNPSANIFQIWTMQDARCREIFWAWWLKEMAGRKDAWFDKPNGSYMIKVIDRIFYGYRIAEAEIACITAIMEAE
jgi:hypothetical protein